MRASAAARTVARSSRVTDHGSGTPTLTSLRPIGAPRRSTRWSAVRARMQPPATARRRDGGDHRLGQAVEAQTATAKAAMKRSIAGRSYATSATRSRPGQKSFGMRGGEQHAANRRSARQLGRGGGELLHERLVDRVATRLVEPQHRERPSVSIAHTAHAATSRAEYSRARRSLPDGAHNREGERKWRPRARRWLRSSRVPRARGELYEQLDERARALLRLRPPLPDPAGPRRHLPRALQRGRDAPGARSATWPACSSTPWRRSPSSTRCRARGRSPSACSAATTTAATARTGSRRRRCATRPPTAPPRRSTPAEIVSRCEAGAARGS